MRIIFGLMLLLVTSRAQDSRCLLKNGLKSLTFFVPESQAIGSEIGSLEIIGDAGKTILLKFESNNSPLTIVPFTKTVMLRKKLDKENETGPSLVSANLLCERLSIVTGQQPNFKNHSEVFSVPIIVQVLDENDNEPRFVNEPLVYNVSESIEPGTRLSPRIVAVDKDRTEKYSRIHYSIVPSFYSNLVRFDNDNDGILIVNSSLDYETLKEFVIVVQANDDGQPPKVTTTKIQINVLDADDNDPKFVSDIYQVFVTENETELEAGLVLPLVPHGKVEAIDLDHGIQAGINYYFNSNDYYYQYFAIDKSSGVVTLRKNLPRFELKQPIVLHIRGSQVDNPDKYANCKVIVSLKAKVIKFLKKSHYAVVPENLPTGRSLINLQLNQPVNANLKFFISEADLVDLLSIGAHGDLVLNQPLDYETTDSYKFKVFVTDGRFNDTTAIEIAVRNVNDCEPRFRYPLYEFEISNNDYVTSFGRIEVSDCDRNDSVTLRVTGTNATLFAIDAINGDLSLKDASLLLRERLHGDAVFSVVATDAGGLTARVPVIVHFPAVDTTHRWGQIQTAKHSTASALIFTFFVLLSLFTLVMIVFVVYLLKTKNNDDTSTSATNDGDNDDGDENISHIQNPVFASLERGSRNETPAATPKDFYRTPIAKSLKRYPAPNPPQTNAPLTLAAAAAPTTATRSVQKHETFWSYSHNYIDRKSCDLHESKVTTETTDVIREVEAEDEAAAIAKESETLNRIETINVNSTKRRPINQNLTVYF